MSYTDKVEVMDFLINVLKDHEKNLDQLISRAEDLVQENNEPKNLLKNPPSLKVSLRDWEEFCDRAVEAELICFDLQESTFYCNALTKNKVYRYAEELPDLTLKLGEDENNLVLSSIKLGKNLEENFSILNGQLEIGLELHARKIKISGGRHKIEYELGLLYTKNWLSRELGVHRDFVVYGSID